MMQAQSRSLFTTPWLSTVGGKQTSITKYTKHLWGRDEPVGSHDKVGAV